MIFQLGLFATLFSAGFPVVWIAIPVAWVLTLINAAQTEQWGWFAMILVFGPLVSALYLCVGHRSRNAAPIAASSKRRQQAKPRSYLEQTCAP